MKRPLQCLVVPLALAGLAGIANADIDKRQSCVEKRVNPPGFNSAQVRGVTDKKGELLCFVGFKCQVGLRGDWLDLTDDIDGAGASRLRIERKGVQRKPAFEDGIGGPSLCVPDGTKDRHGWIQLSGTPTGTGVFRIKLNRPGALGMGRDSDTVTVRVKRADRFLAEVSPDLKVARTGESVRLKIVGGGMGELRFAPSRDYEVLALERFADSARVELRFRRAGDYNLLDMVGFADEPVHEELSKFKRAHFNLRVVAGSGEPAPERPESAPDVAPFTNKINGQGLFREVRGAPAGTVDPQFCTSAGAQPGGPAVTARIDPLEWGVRHGSADNRTISRAFNVTLYDTRGSSNKFTWQQLDTFTVTTLNSGQPVIRNTYPNRPSEVQVRLIGDRCEVAQQDRSFDPPQLAIRVDFGPGNRPGVLTEPNEDNNDLVF